MGALGPPDLPCSLVLGPHGGGAVGRAQEVARGRQRGLSLRSGEPAEGLGLSPVVCVSTLPLGLRTVHGPSPWPVPSCAVSRAAESLPVWRVLDGRGVGHKGQALGLITGLWPCREVQEPPPCPSPCQCAQPPSKGCPLASPSLSGSFLAVLRA